MEFIDRLLGTRAPDDIRRGDSPGATSAYRCVEIKAGGDTSCAAVSALNGQRFLPQEIPDLPLPGCTAEACSCRYELHVDRRRHPRAGGPAGNPSASELRRDNPD